MSRSFIKTNPAPYRLTLRKSLRLSCSLGVFDPPVYEDVGLVSVFTH